MTDIIASERRRDSLLRGFAYGVLSLVAIAAIVIGVLAFKSFGRDHTLLKNSAEQRTEILHIINDADQTLNEVQRAVRSGAASSAAAAAVIADVETELSAICRAVDCHGVSLRSFGATTGGETPTTTTVPTRRKATTTTTVQRSATTTTTTTRARPCTTVPVVGPCLLGGSHANNSKR